MVDNQNIGPIVGASVVALFAASALGLAFFVKGDNDDTTTTTPLITPSYVGRGRGRTRRHRSSRRGTRKH